MEDKEDSVFWEYEGKEMVDEQAALMEVLSSEGVAFVHATDGGAFFESQDKNALITISVNCNDLWMWGCADAEPLPFSELGPLVKELRANPQWGAWIWACKYRGLQPQPPVKQDMIKAGVWSDALETLDKNPFDKDPVAARRTSPQNQVQEAR